MNVLVTGGTGVVGSRVVDELRGEDVRVLSRRDRPPVPEGVRAVRGDLSTGAGLAEAVRDVDAVVHCASATKTPFYGRAKRVDVDGTRRLIHAASETGLHLVYISIVGVDRIPLGYYRAKLEGERIVEASGLPWTIQRTTQFHELVGDIVRMATRPPVGVTPKGVRFQPVDAGEVASRLAVFARSGPVGRAPDFGGPEVHPALDLALTYLKARGSNKRVIDVFVPGRTSRAFRDGHNLCPEGDKGAVGWGQWLAGRTE